MPFDSLHELLKAQIVTNVQNKCKQYVMGALYEDFDGIVYGFDLKMNYIELHPVAYQFMLKYKMELERLNYYAWAKFLEKVNDDNVLIRLLDKLELSLPQRNNLDVYRNILYKEFEEDTCFYCGKKFIRSCACRSLYTVELCERGQAVEFCVGLPNMQYAKK